MTEIVTRSNYIEDIETKNIDVATYVKEYIDYYKNIFDDDISIKCKSFNKKITKKISVLNLSIVLDNLISNSIKWGAKNILINFYEQDAFVLKIVFSDDGLGLSRKFTNNPELIFDLGVKDSPPSRDIDSGGSGIGLYFSKNLLNEMHADIHYLGNDIDLKGACFEIVFS